MTPEEKATYLLLCGWRPLRQYYSSASPEQLWAPPETWPYPSLDEIGMKYTTLRHAYQLQIYAAGGR